MATDADNDEGWGGDFRKHVARSKCTEKENADGFLFSWAFSGRGGGECEGRPIQGGHQKRHQEEEGGGKGGGEGGGGGGGREGGGGGKGGKKGGGGGGGWSSTVPRAL